MRTTTLALLVALLAGCAMTPEEADRFQRSWEENYHRQEQLDLQRRQIQLQEYDLQMRRWCIENRVRC